MSIWHEDCKHNEDEDHEHEEDGTFSIAKNHLKDARWNIGAGSIGGDDHICGKGSVKSFARAEVFRGYFSFIHVFYDYMVTQQSYQLGDQDERWEDLLYMRISGFQRLEGGTRMSFTPPYSASSHLMLLSVHSCALFTLNITKPVDDIFCIILIPPHVTVRPFLVNPYCAQCPPPTLVKYFCIILGQPFLWPLSTSCFSILHSLFCRHYVDCLATFLGEKYN